MVEDFDDSRFSLGKLLEMEGYEVLEAIDGAQAVELARTSVPDMILMDISLPVIDGLTATRQIRGLENLRNVPIIVLSGHEFTDIEDQIRDSGCTDYMTKPIDFDVLTKKIAQYI